LTERRTYKIYHDQRRLREIHRTRYEMTLWFVLAGLLALFFGLLVFFDHLGVR